MLDTIYLKELQLNKTNIKVPFLDLNVSIHASNDAISTKLYNQRGDFAFDNVSFPFLDEDVLVLHPEACIFLSQFFLDHLNKLAL